MPGKLYLVATPIGNLADMTPRALQTLKEADCIAAEDTRRTLQLLNHFSIKGKLIHYDENNKAKQGPVLLERLLAGENIALVTDAGFPGISDPGEAMAALAIAHGVTVVPLPGANACLTALVASGLPSTPFFFGAFLPKVSATAVNNWRLGKISRLRWCCMKRPIAFKLCWRKFWPPGETAGWRSAGS